MATTDPNRKVQGPRRRGDLPRLLTVEEAAAVLRVTPAYVTRRLVFEKRLAYVKVGRQVLFDEKVIAEFIAKRTVTPSDYGSERRAPVASADRFKNMRAERKGRR